MNDRRVKLEDLPDDCLYEIFRFFSPGVLNKVSTVSSKFHGISNNPALWKRHYLELGQEVAAIETAGPTDYRRLFGQYRQRQVKGFAFIAKTLNHTFNAKKLLYLIDEEDEQKINHYLDSVHEGANIIIAQSLYPLTLVHAINSKSNPSLNKLFFDRIYREFVKLYNFHSINYHPRKFRRLNNFVNNSIASVRSLFSRSEPSLIDLLTLYDTEGFRLFHWACLFGQMDFLMKPEVLKIEPDTIIGPHETFGLYAGKTALMLCAATNSLGAMQYLIDRGANVNLSVRNISVLSLCLRQGGIPALRLLIQHGVNLSGKNNILYELAHHNAQAALAELLLREHRDLFDDQDIIGAIHHAIYENNYDIFLLLYPYAIECGVTPDSLITNVNFDSIPSVGSIDCLRFLLVKGVSLGAGQDLLNKAVQNLHFEAVKLLLQHGASPASRGDMHDENAFIQLINDFDYRTQPNYSGFAGRPDPSDFLKMLQLLIENAKDLELSFVESVLDYAQSTCPDTPISHYLETVVATLREREMPQCR